MVTPTTESIPPPQPSTEVTPDESEASRKQKTIITLAIVGVIILVIIIIVAVVLLLRLPPAQTGQIRDIFLIFLALESLVIGVALVVLILQVASLINLLQNEVRPILHATSETVNNLRGTAEFLGENVVEPVIKLNGYLAGLQRVLELMHIKPK